ncbi:DUF1294 domain-containing protein [Shouchella patagoniensis]|uniref:DUF1294 domain-containing protein n=1 Tax=Shouchella patagoniensis TaxID=228576 RepID=UPI0009950D8C|nr:DUF1294 domain-containing protein [Shouchella patagoniensis]
MSIYFGIITIVGFIVMGVDKTRAKTRARRISERNLWIIGLIGGSLGVYIGMYTYRHKTLKRSFSIGVPILIFIQAALGLFIYDAL